MTKAHLRYIWLEQGVAATVINILLNGGIAWLAFRGMETVPLWGAQSIAGDTIATCFLLPAIACLVITRLARHEVRKGRFPAIDPAGRTIPASLPHSVRKRSALLGVIGLVIVAPLAVGVLNALGVTGMPFRSFVLFKAIFAGVLAAIIAPFAAWAGLCDPPAAEPAKS